MTITNTTETCIADALAAHTATTPQDEAAKAAAKWERNTDWADAWAADAPAPITQSDIDAATARWEQATAMWRACPDAAVGYWQAEVTARYIAMQDLIAAMRTQQIAQVQVAQDDQDRITAAGARYDRASGNIIGRDGAHYPSFLAAAEAELALLTRDARDLVVTAVVETPAGDVAVREVVLAEVPADCDTCGNTGRIDTSYRTPEGWERDSEACDCRPAPATRTGLDLAMANAQPPLPKCSKIGCIEGGTTACTYCGAVFCGACAPSGCHECGADPAHQQPAPLPLCSSCGAHCAALPFTPDATDDAEARAELVAIEATAGVTADEPPPSELDLQFAAVSQLLAEWADAVANGGCVADRRADVLRGMLDVEAFARMSAVSAVPPSWRLAIKEE